jgi:hypothetical protein
MDFTDEADMPRPAALILGLTKKQRKLKPRLDHSADLSVRLWR